MNFIGHVGEGVVMLISFQIWIMINLKSKKLENSN